MVNRLSGFAPRQLTGRTDPSTDLRAILGWIPYLERPSAGDSSILMRCKDL
jgi:hypothetical protein